MHDMGMAREGFSGGSGELPQAMSAVSKGTGPVGSTLPIYGRLRWRRDLHSLSKFGSTPQLSSRASLPLMCRATDGLSTPAPAAAELSVHACHPRYSVRVHPAE